MKQKLLAALLVLCMVVALVPAIALTSAAANGVALPDGATAYDGNPSTSLSGTGTDADPFIIANTADFMCFYESLAATATAGQVFKMTGDVYWNAQNSTKYQLAAVNFAGVLNGDGHTIYNAYYGSDSGSSKAVFGTVTGVIKNVNFDGLELRANNANVSGLCQTLSGSDATVENCQFLNTVITGKGISGIVGAIAAGAVVRDCVIEGTLTGSNSVGGVVGSISASQTGTIDNCVNRANILGKATKAGGIIGAGWSEGASIPSLTISNCVNYGNITITGTNAYVGGIFGCCSRLQTLTIVGCANHGQISATGNTGGIIGYGTSNKASQITIDKCQNTGAITSTGANAGGIAGYLLKLYANVTIQNSRVIGSVSGASNVGGFVGSHVPWDYSTSNLYIINSSVEAAVTASENYAGIAVGYHTAADSVGTISATNCVFTGTVSAQKGAGGVLGYIGYQHAKGVQSNVKVINTFVNVSVEVSTDANAATLIGEAQSGITGVVLDTTDSAISVKVFVGDNEVSAPTTYYTYPTDGELTAQTVELPAMEANALTNKTAVAKLNAYATENSFAEWVQGANAPELTHFYVAPEVPEITIDGASLTIGGNVTMNLFVKKTTVAAAGVTPGKISIVDNDNTPYEVTDDSGDYYVFTIKGLRASEFGKNKIYHVQYTTADAPETAIDCTATKEYSPLQYAINMYGETDKAGLDALLLSIVNYADAAAKSTDARTAFEAAHTDADFSTLPTFAKIIEEDKGVYTYDELKVDKNLPGISAELTETIALIFTFDGSDSYEKDNSDMMMIGDTAIEGKLDGLSVVFSGLFATDLYNTITLTFKETYDNGLTVQATTSLVQFLKSYQGTAEATLATATAQYLYAARYFCLNNQPNA